MEDQAQQLIDATTPLYKAGKIAANPFGFQKGVAIPPTSSLAVPSDGMPPMSLPPGMPQGMMPPLPGTHNMPPPDVGMMVSPIPPMMRPGPVPPMMMSIPPPIGQMKLPMMTNPQMNVIPP